MGNSAAELPCDSLLGVHAITTIDQNNLMELCITTDLSNPDLLRFRGKVECYVNPKQEINAAQPQVIAAKTRPKPKSTTNAVKELIPALILKDDGASHNFVSTTYLEKLKRKNPFLVVEE